MAGSVKLGAADLTPRYTVFVSSGDDALKLRDRVSGLIEKAINPILAQHEIDIRLEADLWDRDEPRRLGPGETIDDQFVKRAVASNLVMTLLLDVLGSGTKKEIEAVMASDTELAALWFVNRDEKPETPVSEYLKELQERVRYRKAGRPATNESWEAIVQVLLSAVLQAMKQESEDFREQR